MYERERRAERVYIEEAEAESGVGVMSYKGVLIGKTRVYLVIVYYECPRRPPRGVSLPSLWARLAVAI